MREEGFRLLVFLVVRTWDRTLLSQWVFPQATVGLKANYLADRSMVITTSKSMSDEA
jgi:hypothetical protein